MVMRFVVLIGLVADLLAAGQTSPAPVAAKENPTPIARYALVGDLGDSTGLNPPISARNAPFVDGKGLFCNGQYVLSVPSGCDVVTPPLNRLDFSAFTITARFFVPTGSRGGPVFVGGRYSRWLSYDLRPGGRIDLTVNSNQRIPCSVSYRIGSWHEAAITFDGTTTTLFLDGAAGCHTTTPLRTSDEKFLLLTNYASGTTFFGLLRDLTIFNGVVAPTRRQPEADTFAIPAPADLTPADKLLANCPTRAQVASIDSDLRLSFDTDPTEKEPLACSEREGSRDLSPLKKRVYNTLLLARSVQFDRPLPWTKQPLYQWLTGAIRGVRFRGDIDTSSCCNPSRVVNIAVSRNVVVTTDRWMDPTMQGGLHGFLLVLVHEARHADGLPHTCGTKDQTVDEMGAWGVQYSLSRWLAEHTDQSFFANDTIRAADWLRKQAEQLRTGAFCR